MEMTIENWLNEYINGNVDEDTCKQLRKGDFGYILKKYEETKNPDLSYLLGHIYHNGYNGNKNLQEALRFYEIAIKDKHFGAMNNAGYIYYNDFNDIEKAVEYYTMSILEGNETSFKNLMFIYSKNKETEKMFNLCELWFTTHNTTRVIIEYMSKHKIFAKKFMCEFLKNRKVIS